MHVRRERTADAEPIRARLLLTDRPWSRAPRLERVEAAHERRPLDPRLHLYETMLRIEGDHPIESARVEQQTVLSELLAAHRVPSAGDADCVVRSGGPDDVAGVGGTPHVDDGTHTGSVEPRMNVIDHFRAVVRLRSGRSRGVERVGFGSRAGMAHRDSSLVFRGSSTASAHPPIRRLT